MITFSRLGRYGQLGNQLFQCAVLLGVAAKTGYKVQIPYGGRVKKKDLVELDHFEHRLPALWNRDRIQCRRHPFLYEGLVFNPKVFDQPDFTDFAGYYQSEKYFKHAEQEVRKRFTFGRHIRDRVDATCSTWRQTYECLVAIHVRRGDYLDCPNNFTILSADYIQRARELFPHNRQFMVFSDDLPWCEANIRGNDVSLVTSPDHWHDMYMMTQCDHHIISASSFGWWGAWLSTNPHKRVIAPKPWFPATANIDTRDVVPENWIQLEV